MKIPKEILRTIHNIENFGQLLKIEELKLYEWLEKQNINTDFYNENSIDSELNYLFQNNSGKELIKKLEEI